MSSDWVVSEFGDLVLAQLPRMWMEYMHGYLASTAVRRALRWVKGCGFVPAGL